MDTITIVMFLSVFALCLVFTILSISLERAEWDFLAMILWYAFAILNIGLAADPLFYDLSYLYWVLGFIFMFIGLKDLFQSFERAAIEQEEEKQWGLD